MDKIDLNNYNNKINIDAIFHKKIVEAMNKEKKLNDIAKTLNLDVIDS